MLLNSLAYNVYNIHKATNIATAPDKLMPSRPRWKADNSSRVSHEKYQGDAIVGAGLMEFKIDGSFRTCLIALCFIMPSQIEQAKKFSPVNRNHSAKAVSNETELKPCLYSTVLTLSRLDQFIMLQSRSLLSSLMIVAIAKRRCAFVG